jgi:FMN-dependent oxidoreductase (nitrilotriacetate monooxygenase family)
LADKIHFNQIMMSLPATHKMGAWADEGDTQFAGLGDFGYWQSVAQELERACFDGIFFADVPVASGGYGEGQKEAIKYGVVWPTHDPMPLAAAMAAATKRLGFILTLSIVGHHPYLAVRRLSTLDYLSNGRMGWNIVTGAHRAEHSAVGAEQPVHDDRYEVAEEFIEVCYRLWGSIDRDAVVFDRKNRIFADPSKVRRVEYKGKHFSCTAYVPTLLSPQGHPVIFQAGSSGRGMEYAVKHAEAVFAIQPSLDHMKRYMASLDAEAKRQGMTNQVKVMFGVQPVIGGTEEEARAIARRTREEVLFEAGLARLSGTINLDFSKFDPDEPLAGTKTEGGQGLLAAFSSPLDGKSLTLRDIALNFGVCGGTPRLVGTPEQVADKLIDLWRTTGCHGFNMSPMASPTSIFDFTREVVPILQKRGVYRTEYPAKTLRENLSA